MIWICFLREHLGSLGEMFNIGADMTSLCHVAEVHVSLLK